MRADGRGRREKRTPPRQWQSHILKGPSRFSSSELGKEREIFTTEALHSLEARKEASRSKSRAPLLETYLLALTHPVVNLPAHAYHPSRVRETLRARRGGMAAWLPTDRKWPFTTLGVEEEEEEEEEETLDEAGAAG